MRVLLIDRNLNINSLDEELQNLYRHYKKVYESKSIFEKIVHLKVKNLQLYLQKCIDLAKSVKFISFRKDRQVFQVRVSYLKKKIYLGQYASFDDACDALNEWFKLEKQNTEN